MKVSMEGDVRAEEEEWVEVTEGDLSSGDQVVRLLELMRATGGITLDNPVEL